MSGTEWTEPGQGATVRQLHTAIMALREFGPHPLKPASKPKFFFLGYGLGTDDALVVPAVDGLNRIYESRGSARPRTNIRLTGAPLTGDDLKRIAEAK